MDTETGLQMFSHQGVSYPVEAIAIEAHNQNAVYCDSIGDSTQTTWSQATEGIRKSAVIGVINIILEPEMTPEMSHDNWVRYKLEQGWGYGEVKSVENKTHPCIVSWKMLSLEQQKKDNLFIELVKNRIEQVLASKSEFPPEPSDLVYPGIDKEVTMEDVEMPKRDEAEEQSTPLPTEGVSQVEVDQAEEKGQQNPPKFTVEEKILSIIKNESHYDLGKLAEHCENLDAIIDNQAMATMLSIIESKAIKLQSMIKGLKL